MNAIQYSPKAVHYMQQVFLWAHQSRRRKRHLDHFSRFLQCSPGDRPTNRPTDHATRSVTIGGAHSGEAKFCYCVRLQQVFKLLEQSTQIQHACLSFVSVHQMAPSVTEVGGIQLHLTTHLWTLKGWKAELAWMVDL